MTKDFVLSGARSQYGPDRPLRVPHIDLHLEPNLEARTIDGVCTATVEALDDDVEGVELDCVDIEVFSVSCSGVNLEFKLSNGRLRAEFALPLQYGERSTVTVRYRVSDPKRGAYFVAAAGQLWTQSQDSDARRWFPCLDYPDNKQTSCTTIVVRRGLFALSNGALVERRDDQLHSTFVYRQNLPHSAYLFTLVVGAFVEEVQNAGALPMFYYVAPGREEDAARSFGETPRMLAVFEDFIGVEYPFARYSQIAVAEFVYGGMENTSATTLPDRTLHDRRAHLDFSSEPLVAHELAHQWFGNLLTARDWTHIWLNEGFATYFEAIWYEAKLGRDEYAYYIKTLADVYLEEESERYVRPIVCNRFDDPCEVFDRHSYQKGALLLHLVRGTLGERGFKRAIHRYVVDNAGGSVETIDFVRAIERATGKNLRQVFDQWSERSGHPALEVAYRFDERSSVVVLEIKQTQLIDRDNLPFVLQLNVGVANKLPAVLGRNAGDELIEGESRIQLCVERQCESFVIPVTSEPKLLRIDPGAYLIGKVRYEFDDEMLERILAFDPDVGARIRAAEALGRKGSSVAQRALPRALRDEPFWGVAIEIARALGATRVEWARDALLRERGHANAKVRRAILEALGNFSDSRDVASALIEMLDDASYYVVAAALESLGKSRDDRALPILTKHSATSSWSELIAGGALRGIAALADPRGVAVLLAATNADRPSACREAALRALPTLYDGVFESRSSIAVAVERALESPSYFVCGSAIAAAHKIGARGFSPALQRIVDGDVDRRLRRRAREALLAIREMQQTPSAVTVMRDEISDLRAELTVLRGQMR